MKRISMMIASWCILLLLQGIAYAEPYQKDAFPPEKVLKGLFERIGHGNVKFQRTVGKKKDGEGNYVVYYQLKDMKKNSLHNESMPLIRLDNKIWIAYPYSEGEMAEMYVILEAAK